MRTDAEKAEPAGPAVMERHNHRHCVARALEGAEAACAGSGQRMTALRRRVLEQVWRGHDAVKAYEILERLGLEARPAKPPTVYRALQFLQELGVVHRLESLNAFVGCVQPEGCHQGPFLICNGCGEVREIQAPRVNAAIAANARREGFKAVRQTIEVFGWCKRCR